MLGMLTTLLMNIFRLLHHEYTHTLALDCQLVLPLDRLNPLSLPQCPGLDFLLYGSLNFLQDIFLTIPVALITSVNSLVNIIPKPLVLFLRGLIE